MTEAEAEQSEAILRAIKSTNKDLEKISYHYLVSVHTFQHGQVTISNELKKQIQVLIINEYKEKLITLAQELADL